ncbi:MAG: OmpP1/FadL family transporter [Gammaproteobacteria bacterium]|nr:OmpP1/FadL family transporter [Gammaproteobacteria bacterium]MCF6364073.1 OmpP1/FadL family transporter [Gammaproteobacteria bacterium]
MRTPIRLTLAATALTTFGLGVSASHAGGFALIEQGVKGLGNAYAGAAASAEDASTIFFNPAGMTLLDGHQAIVGLHIIQPSTKFSDNGSNTSGGNGGDAADLAVIPNLFLVADINDEVKLGLGISVPFGLGTNYDKDWKGRYQAVETTVEVININPSLAFKVNPQWSVGLGANIQYFKAKLTNAVDFSALGAPDGFSDITGDSWGFGYNLGVLFAPSEATRIGLAYRSQVKHSLDGEADFTLPAAAVQVLPAIAVQLADTDISGDIDLPSTLSLSLFHQFSDAWTLLADITRTGWSSYDKLVIEFDNPAKGPSTEVNNWEDVNRYSVGVNFTPNQTWIYRAGFAFDESPVPSAELRSARSPGSDRTWLALGFGYQASKNLTFDLGYAHLFAKDADIDRARAGATGDLLKGSYESDVDILSGQVVWVF